MGARNETEVVIDGKSLTISGFESREYLQEVAAYINGKLADFRKSDSFRRMDRDSQNLMIEINMADDYFKAKKMADDLEADEASKDKEIYDLKHDLISAQIKLDAANQEIEQLKTRNSENQKTIVKLETEIDNLSSRK